MHKSHSHITVDRISTSHWDQNQNQKFSGTNMHKFRSLSKFSQSRPVHHHRWGFGEAYNRRPQANTSPPIWLGVIIEICQFLMPIFPTNPAGHRSDYYNTSPPKNTTQNPHKNKTQTKNLISINVKFALNDQRGCCSFNYIISLDHYFCFVTKRLIHKGTANTVIDWSLLYSAISGRGGGLNERVLSSSWM